MLQRGFDVARQILHAQVAHGNSEVVPRHIFQFVGLIENHRCGFRQDSRVRRAFGLQLDGEIGEEQMMIDDNDVALHPSPAHFSDEAALPLAALLPDAGVGARIQLVPERAGLGKFGQFRAVAGRGRLLPRGDGAVLLDLLQPAEHRLVGKVVEFFAAQIIVAAFHVADGKPSVRTIAARTCFSKQRLLQERNVLVEKLFLQILGAGRDDHALAGANHRHQIGQRLSCARAGFHDQVPLFFKCLLDRLRHLQLAAPEFIGGMRAREHCRRGQRIGRGLNKERPTRPFRRERSDWEWKEERVGNSKPRESL